jgi:hypothetical protein
VTDLDARARSVVAHLLGEDREAVDLGDSRVLPYGVLGHLGGLAEGRAAAQVLGDHPTVDVGVEHLGGALVDEPAVVQTVRQEHDVRRETVSSHVGALPHVDVVACGHAGEQRPAELGAAHVSAPVRAHEDEREVVRLPRRRSVPGDGCRHVDRQQVVVAVDLEAPDPGAGRMRRREEADGSGDGPRARATDEHHPDAGLVEVREHSVGEDALRSLRGPRARVLDEHPRVGPTGGPGHRLVEVAGDPGAADATWCRGCSVGLRTGHPCLR